MGEYIFSVIVPVYNVSQYLERCVDSILGQKFEPLEVILVDDGSTDESGKICDRYCREHENVKCFHKQNGGLSSARNYGISKASGDYLCFIDSDDYICADAFFCLNDYIVKYNQPDVILENGQYNDNQGIISLEKKYKGGANFGRLAGKEAFKKLTEGEALWAAFGKCFRSEYWNRKGFSFKENITSEDLELIYKVIFCAESVVMTEVPFYTYQINRKGSIINNFSFKDMADLLYIFDSWEQFYQDNEIEADYQAGMNRLLGEVYYRYILCRIPFYKIKKCDIDFVEKVQQHLLLLKYTNYSYLEKVFTCLGFPCLVLACNCQRGFRRTENWIKTNIVKKLVCGCGDRP